MRGLREIFRRKTAALAPISSPAAATTPIPEQPLSPEALEELRNAWAELDAATKESGVKNIHACSRSGAQWQKDPAAVRTIAAAIREKH